MSKIVVCSTAEQSYQFVLNDSRVIVINGKNKQFVGANRQQFILPYGKTMMEESDFEAIKAKYKGCLALSQGLIFAEKTIDKSEARARDEEQQAKSLGTKGLEEKDLISGVKVIENPIE